METPSAPIADGWIDTEHPDWGRCPPPIAYIETAPQDAGAAVRLGVSVLDALPVINTALARISPMTILFRVLPTLPLAPSVGCTQWG
jgi:hypothetical protein